MAKTPLIDGRYSFTIEGENYGSYTISMGIIEKSEENEENVLTQDIIINFEETLVTAKNVVIFVGERSYFKDGEPGLISHAPWISYGHVFVPVTFLTEIFALEVLPSPSPKTLILRRDDKELYIDQAALSLTFTEKGVAATQPIGALFLQEQENAYFLPVVTIARLFGAEVDHQPKQGTVEHITFNLQ
jgi:hypothetical protein